MRYSSWQLSGRSAGWVAIGPGGWGSPSSASPTSVTVGARATYRITLPTTLVLELCKPGGVGPFHPEAGPDASYWLVGHCFWSLLAATIGGTLAAALFAALFAAPQAAAVRLADQPRRQRPPLRVPWRGVVAAGLATFIPLAALVLYGLRSDPAFWVGALSLTTWVLLGVTVLGFACGSGPCRMTWLGAALFGLGYMVLNRSGDRFEQSSYVHLLADDFLEAVRPNLLEVVRGFPAKTAAMAIENARIQQLLDQRILMRFREETALENLLDHVRAATRATDGRELPIYVAPQGLRDAVKTLHSVVQIDLKGRPLCTTLRLALKQLILC